jgi:cell division protein FtsZ
MADDVLYQGVKGVTDLMVRPGLINLDFADVRAVMDEMGKAMMGTGESTGEDRAVQAAEKAIANPLLDEISLRGARGVLINITGGHDLTLFELDEAANRIREEVDPDANIIVGSTLDTTLDGSMRVSVVATGIDASEVETAVPVPRRPMAHPLSQTPVAAAPVEEPQPAAVEETYEAPQDSIAPSATSVAEPSLFGDFDTEREAATEQMEDIFDEQPAARLADDDLPPPAYQPQLTPVETVTAAEDDGLGGYVAPKAPAPGTPSPEALAKLRAITGQQRAAPAAESAAEERPRFGINSLIGRMTGGQAKDAAPERTAPPAPRPMGQQAAVSAGRPEPQAQEEEDRIEIPAFLRRQAN